MSVCIAIGFTVCLSFGSYVFGLSCPGAGILVVLILGFFGYYLIDIISSLYAPKTLKDSQILRCGEITLWHVTNASITNFSSGLDFTYAKTQFLGSGFYVWTNLEDAWRYASSTSKGLIEVGISKEAWMALTILKISSKFTVTYWWLTTIWPWRTLRCYKKHCRNNHNPSLYYAWRFFDAIQAPGLSNRLQSSQMLLRDTVTVRHVLSTATMVYYPIHDGRLPQPKDCSH